MNTIGSLITMQYHIALDTQQDWDHRNSTQSEV